MLNNSFNAVINKWAKYNMQIVPSDDGKKRFSSIHILLNLFLNAYLFHLYYYMR